VLDAEQLNDADEQILDVLREGRATPALVSDVADLGRSYVSQRLIRLEEHGNVDELVRGLYELRYDPRETDADAGDEQRRLRESAEALKDERAELQEQLADAHERIDELEERLRQQRVDADRIAEDLEAALEAGDERRVEAALDRLDDLANGGGE
jgi:DNA-binding transcriptional ArsR family regulator